MLVNASAPPAASEGVHRHDQAVWESVGVGYEQRGLEEGGTSGWQRRPAVEVHRARSRAPRVRSSTTWSCTARRRRSSCPFVMGVMSDLSGQARRAAAAGGRPQVPRDRRRTTSTRASKAHEAARGLPGAQHADGRGQPRRGHHLREHGRLLARRRRAARSTAAAPSCWRRATQLANLLTYMDGKTGAEQLMARCWAISGRRRRWPPKSRRADATHAGPGRNETDPRWPDPTEMDHGR